MRRNRKCCVCEAPATIEIWCYEYQGKKQNPFCSEKCFKKKCYELRDGYMTARYGPNWKLQPGARAMLEAEREDTIQ